LLYGHSLISIPLHRSGSAYALGAFRSAQGNPTSWVHYLLL